MTPERQEAFIRYLRTMPGDSILHMTHDGAGSRLAFTVAELLEAIAQKLPHTKLTTATRDTIEHWLGGLADCSCWFRGFEAAKADEAGSIMPPGWRILTEISTILKSHLAATGDPTEREVDLPF